MKIIQNTRRIQVAFSMISIKHTIIFNSRNVMNFRFDAVLIQDYKLQV